MTKHSSRSKFGKGLLVLETIWIVFFIGLSIGSYVKTTSLFFMDPMSVAYGFDDIIRTDIMALSTHIVTSVTVAGMLQVHWSRPYYWLSFFFLFILYKDVSHVIEFVGFSKIRSFEETRGLWIAGIVLACYQTLLTLGACVCYGMILYQSSQDVKQHKKQDNPYLDMSGGFF